MHSTQYDLPVRAVHPSLNIVTGREFIASVDSDGEITKRRVSVTYAVTYTVTYAITNTVTYAITYAATYTVTYTDTYTVA